MTLPTEAAGSAPDADGWPASSRTRAASTEMARPWSIGGSGSGDGRVPAPTTGSPRAMPTMAITGLYGRRLSRAREAVLLTRLAMRASVEFLTLGLRCKQGSVAAGSLSSTGRVSPRWFMRSADLRRACIGGR